jgi:hypothetical protein
LDLVTTLINVGATGACLIALGLATWRVAVWLATKAEQLLGPVLQRHVRFLDDLAQAVANQSQALQAMVEEAKKDREARERILIRQEQILDMVEKMLEHQEAMIERQQKGGGA